MGTAPPSGEHARAAWRWLLCLTLCAGCGAPRVMGWAPTSRPPPSALPETVDVRVGGALGDPFAQLLGAGLESYGYQLAPEPGWLLVVEVSTFDTSAQRSLHRIYSEMSIRGLDPSGAELFRLQLTRTTGPIAGPAGGALQPHLVELADAVLSRIPRVHR